MTYRDALKHFKEEMLPSLPNHDKPAKGEAWSVYLDTLHRNGQITDKQVQNWDNPFYK